MTRKRWIQHPITLKLIPADEYVPPARAASPFVMDDIKPYKSMITGEMIQGRAQHRAHLREHGCIEVGNEKIPDHRETPIRREDIRRDLFQVAAGKGF